MGTVDDGYDRLARCEGFPNGDESDLPIAQPDLFQKTDFGIGEHVYFSTPLMAFLVGNHRNESGPTPTLCVWYCHQRARWVGVLHSRAGSCSAFLSSPDLPDLIVAFGKGIREERLIWRPDRDQPSS